MILRTYDVTGAGAAPIERAFRPERHKKYRLTVSAKPHENEIFEIWTTARGAIIEKCSVTRARGRTNGVGITAPPDDDTAEIC